MLKSLVIVTLITALLLLVPLVAMQFTHEVRWSPADFAVAGALLFSAGIAIALVLRGVSRPRARIIAVAAIVFALAVVWAELAVGLFR